MDATRKHAKVAYSTGPSSRVSDRGSHSGAARDTATRETAPVAHGSAVDDRFVGATTSGSTRVFTRMSPIVHAASEAGNARTLVSRHLVRIRQA